MSSVKAMKVECDFKEPRELVEVLKENGIDYKGKIVVVDGRVVKDLGITVQRNQRILVMSPISGG
ncbi:MAG: MoaD/ThiS family protein [Thermoplasmata archaeon]